MAHIVSVTPSPEDETQSRRDRLAERMADVVHLVVQKVVERKIAANVRESTSTDIHKDIVSK